MKGKRKSVQKQTHGSPKSSSAPRMTEEKFVLRAIDRLHQPKYKGIHTVYSGFNEAFREYYGKDADPVAATKRLATDGKVVIMPSRGGVILYKKGDEPVLAPKPKNGALDKILK